MTALAMVLAFQAAPVSVVEVPDPSAKRLRVEIVARLPKLDRVDWAAAQVLRNALTFGTRSYTRFQLAQYASLAGEPIATSLSIDSLRVGFSVPANDVRLAVELADALVREALLPAEDVQREIEELPFRRRGAWEAAWSPWVGKADTLKVDDVKLLYRNVFQPGSVTIGIGGAFPPMAAKTKFVERFASWKDAPPDRRRYPEPPPSLAENHPGGWTTISFEGADVGVVPVVTAAGSDDTKVPEAILASAMLGMGKGCTAFRVLRDSNGWSYRQEAYLRPSQDGIQPVLTFGVSGKRDFADLAEKARAQLAEAVEKWSEADRAEAASLLRSAVELELPLGVLHFSDARPLSQSLEDRTFLAAYWASKTGRVWNWQMELDRASAVSLETAQAFALAWLRDGKTRIIRSP